MTNTRLSNRKDDKKLDIEDLAKKNSRNFEASAIGGTITTVENPQGGLKKITVAYF